MFTKPSPLALAMSISIAIWLLIGLLFVH